MRGNVVPLTPEQRVARLWYLAGKTTIDKLDPFVRMGAASPPECPTIFYLLHDHNGGKDPTAPDPADYWSNVGSPFVNRTCDCIGGQAWAGGWDRYQPVRFAHIYDGWINTDSMRMDAGGPAKCFERIARPEPGCMVVYASGACGHAIGHIGGVAGVHHELVEWDDKEPECWKLLDVVDVAARRAADATPIRANKLTTGIGWYGKDSWFVRSIMEP